MPRYIGIVWNPASLTQSNEVEALTIRSRMCPCPWSVIFTGNGIRVFCPGGQSVTTHLHNGAGVVVGSIFRRKGDTPAIPGSHMPVAICKWLIEHHWGHYTAFLSDGHENCVLRAPISNLPCLRTVSATGVQLYAALLSDFMHFAQRVTVNWKHLAVHLTKPMRCGHTAMNEVTELLDGECLTTYSGRVTHQRYWDAEQVAACQRIEDEPTAMALLHEATRAGVEALYSEHDAVLLRLSGGLDSSIVSGCATRGGTRVISINHHSGGNREDERHFARAAARYSDHSLIEMRRNPRIRLEDALKAPLSERPGPYHRRLETSPVEQQLAAEHGATAVFSGEGGDHVFYSGYSRLTAVDYVHHHGVRPSLLRVAWASAHADRQDFASVLRLALRHGLKPRQWNPLADAVATRTLITEEVRHELLHTDTWCRSTHTVPYGKQRHIDAALHPWTRFNCIDPEGGLPEIAPLVTQPSVEACLRIPTYILHAQEKNRYLARKAFAQELPLEIQNRYSKGIIDDHFNDILEYNIDFVRPLLLDGALVRERILDRDKLETVLSLEYSTVLKGMFELAACICAEIFAQISESAARRAAA